MICAERERLLHDYHAAVMTYAEVVRQLKKSGRNEFPWRFERADAARENCDHLREKIEEHRATHRC
jgi:hypothetical protein